MEQNSITLIKIFGQTYQIKGKLINDQYIDH